MDIALNENGILSFSEFTNKIKESLTSYFGGERDVRINNVKKNNGINLVGVCALPKNGTIAPTIYLESHYERYKNGKDFSDAFKEIADIIEDDNVKFNFEASSYLDYEKAKNRIVYKLINKEKNNELLMDIPYIEFLDMAIVFYYLLDEASLVNASILIYNSHLKTWGIDKERLYKQAAINSKILLKPVITNMYNVMFDIFKDNIRDKFTDETIKEEAKKCSKNPDEWIEEIVKEMTDVFGGTKNECPMYVLTNDRKMFGAACMLNIDYIHNFAKNIECNLYILPSSIHEVIIVPESDSIIPSNFKDMVCEVNETQVSPDEVLSDSVYYYDLGKKTIIKVY